jgi:hypothetical protein
MVAVGASIVLKQRAAMRTCVRLRRPRLSEAGAKTEAVVKCVIDGHDWCGVEVISMAIRSADETRALSSRIHSLRLVQSPRRHTHATLSATALQLCSVNRMRAVTLTHMCIVPYHTVSDRMYFER